MDVRHDSPVKGVLELLAPKKRLDLRFPSAAEDRLSSTPVLEMNGAGRIDEEDEEELEEFYDAFQDMSSSSGERLIQFENM